ncbi:hypothetical protein MSP7336_01820 [Mycobacterium shimoidei]|uniref:Uncharacterized protein n=1 Tax=Mycobacterium shimoidei TaxID=29313 RepID=A0A375YXE0_MYCSH|nr:hypothetical protein [Mycobacterium shimoidei]SRX93581.1 hypothetical protein MSP7336_01820 [Mycobacterium shimoidei]
MPHFRVDDALHSHPKAQKAADEALGMWVRAGSFCMAYLTDGFVPEWWVKQQPKGLAKAKRLVAAGLWHLAERDGERGWEFHEWLGPGRQDSRAKGEAEREAARQRKANWRASQRESQPTSHPESRRDTQRDERRTPGTNPTQPNPTRISVVTSGGELTQVAPPPFCPRHPNGTEKPCGACADARRAFQAWETDRAEAMAKARADFWADVRACPNCDDNGQVDHGNAVSRCPNHDWKATHA